MLAMRTFGAVLVVTGWVALMGVTFPGVAVEWTTGQQWFCFGTICVAATIGIWMLVIGGER